MLIRKPTPRALAPDQPIRHEAAHKRPVTRRDFIGQGLLAGAATLVAPTVFGLFASPSRAMAALAPDLELLRQYTADPREYGRQLAAGLFKEAGVLAGFKSARDTAASQGLALRLRLLIGPSASELHGLRWEMLADPDTGAPLLLGQNLLFSRYLTSPDARPVRLRPKGELRLLAAVANTADLGEQSCSESRVHR